jgi:probable rRNA maturation factor
MPLDIAIEDDGWAALTNLELLVEQAVAAALPKGEQGKIITVLFADNETMQDLNNEWRGLNKPTNVLSFPAPKDQPVPPGELPLLGDIVLGFATCAQEAEEAGKTLADHTCHLIVHGVLHLLGYDHENDKDAEVMEAAEIKILSTLGIENPYQS